MPTTYTATKHTHHGQFATTSRLIACLVMEGLVSAYFIPIPTGSTLVGLCALLRSVGGDPVPRTSLSPSDLLAVVPLRSVPILAEETLKLKQTVCYKIELVDPWDMLPHIYGPRDRMLTGHNNTPIALLSDSYTLGDTIEATLATVGLAQSLVDGYDAAQLWTQFANDYGVCGRISDQIVGELESSMQHQAYAYENPKPLPTLDSSSIIWEQSILEGHATHPMHKARKSYPPMSPLVPGQGNLLRPKLRLIAVPETSMTVRGDFMQLLRPLVDAMLQKTHLTTNNFANHLLVPVHELQIPNIEAKFPDAVVLPEANSVVADSLTSIRSVAVPDVLPGLSVKLALGIKVSSALRTITPYTTYFGPGFSTHVVPRLSYDRKVLTIERELASVVYKHPDVDVAKHCSAVIREAVEYPSHPNETIVVCAALLEKIQKPDTDETLVTHVWNLSTQEKREAFLDRYVELALAAFLPPCLKNGVAFEAHGQNTLARFDKTTGELKGFVIRDFGGVKVHNETLKKTCGVELDVLPDSCVVAETLEEVYKLLYHTLIHSQFQRLVRILGLHSNGRGWEIVRKHLTQMIPKDHPMWPVFMETQKIPGKCLLRMKMEELYRDYIYRPVPNVIHYRPQAI